VPSGEAAGTGNPGPGLAVVGRVLRGDGGPLAGAAVTLTDVGGRQVDRTRSGDDGGYRLQPPAGGTYLLIASAPQLAPNASMVALADAPVLRDLVLAGGAVLSGRLLGGDGEPLPGALVTLTDVQGEVVGSSLTGADGRYELGELLGGTYTLAGQAAGHQPVAVTVELTGGTVEQDLSLVDGARVSGVVRADSDGRPLPEATVTLLDESGNVVATTSTGERGRYAFDDLLPGNYTLIASGFAPVATGLQLAAGAEVEHDAVLGGIR
jgi:hypothetical protein